MQLTNAQAHWLRTKRLMGATILLFMLLSICLPMLSAPLDAFVIPYLDLPLGSFMSAQGALIAFLIMLHVFARRQDRIDRDHFIAGT